MAVLQRQAREIDIELDKGSSLEFFVQLLNGRLPIGYSENDLTALDKVDLSVFSEVECTIRPYMCNDDPQLPDIILSKSNGDIIVDDPLTGTFRIKIPSSMSADWGFKNAKYNTTLTYVNGDKMIATYGVLSVHDVML